MPWRVYEVRRALRPRPGDSAKVGTAYRSLRAAAGGTRAAMAEELARIAVAEGTRVLAEDGIGRVWRLRRGAHLPAAQWFWTAAPAGPEDKEGPGFAAAWPLALAGPAQQELALLAEAQGMPRT
jgi:hypothetical protein